MLNTAGIWRCIAGISGFTAVAMGAVGAHAVADAHAGALMEKASGYQLTHALMLAWLSDRSSAWLRAARWAVVIATLLFCGSLYVKALTAWAQATALAPLGGCCFMAAWLLVALDGLFHQPQQRATEDAGER